MSNAFKAVASFIPRGYRKKVEVLLNYAGTDEDVDIWLGKRIVFALLLGVIGGLIVFFYAGEASKELSFLAGASVFLVTCITFYFHLYYVIEERRKRVEAVLPDFLLLIAANLRAGMTPIAAFINSSRPEFGPLEEEIRIVASRSLGTESFVSVFGRLNERIDSKILKRVVGLFTSGMVSGGHLARLLETSALDIRDTQELKQELESSTRMYVIFILFVILIGVPLLLSISIQFLIKLNALRAQITKVSFGEFGYAFLVGATPLEPQFVESMTYVILIGTTFFVSVLLGVINEGKYLYGLRYFLPLAAIGVVDFIILKGVVQGILSSLT
ncbi:MAG: type II secretion system F family protein [Candidatus Micrarchaeia archaeon]